ncbi:MAG TPA: peptidylprolyl isomerase, partial [Polyangia bacterium]
AEDALAQIKSGKEFKEVAAAFSDAPDGIKGGDLGWRVPARLPLVFVDAAKGMQNGDVSAVLRSPGGFHVIKLVDKRAKDAKPFADVQDDIRARLRQREMERQTKIYLSDLRKKVLVDIRL